MKNKFLFCEFEVDSVRRTLLKNGQPVVLNPKTFDLLLAMVAHQGEILSKRDLLDSVWKDQFVEEKNLTVHVAALRKVLGESKNENRFIVTVPGRGYGFVAELRNGESLTAVSPSQTETLGEPKGIEFDTNIDEEEVRPIFISSRGFLLVLVPLVGAAITLGAYFTLKWIQPTVTARPASLTLKRLTTSGKVNLATLSPDGKFFAYTMERGNERSLLVGNVEGGDPLVLRPPEVSMFFSLNFSTDGGSLYYVLTDSQHPQGELFKSPLLGGIQEEVCDGINQPISFSPDGKQFVFTRVDAVSDKSNLLVYDLDTHTERDLIAASVFHRFASFSPTWSPNGRSIFFGAIGTDGRTIELFTVLAEGGDAKKLSGQTWNFARGTAWKKDSSGIYLVGEETGRDDGRWQLYTVSFPEGRVTPFNADLGSYGSSLAISADGGSLLVIQAQLMSNIWLASVSNPAEAKQITFGAPERLDGWYGLDWTPDRRIVYSATTDKSKAVWIMNSDGSGQKQLVPSGGENFLPVVSGDGKYAVFQSNRSGAYEIWRSELNGGDLRQLTSSGIAGEPAVSPDGRWVVYVTGSEDGGDLWRIAIDGGAPVQLSDHRVSWPRVSPNGKFIACGIDDGGGPRLAIMSIDGGEPLKTFEVAKNANLRLGPHWTLDGKSVAYRDWFDGIWLQRLDRSVPEHLTGLPREKIYGFGWSPDGKNLAFTRGTEERDAVLIRGL